MSLPSEQIDVILACLRRETTYESAAARFGVSPDDVKRWEATFVAGGTAALNGNEVAVASRNGNHNPDKTEVLNAAAQALLAIFDLSELVDRALDILHRTFGYFPAIYLIDGPAITANCGYALDGEKLDWNDERLPLAERRTTAAWVGLHGESVNINDTAADSRYTYREQIGDVRSELAVPIWCKETVLGVLSVKSGKPCNFDDDDLRLLERFGFYLGIALKNARLFEALRHRIAQLDLVQSITATAIEDLAVQRVLSFAVQTTCAALGYNAVGIGLIGRDGQRLALTVATRASGPARPTVQLSEVLLEEAGLLGSAALGNRLIHSGAVERADEAGLLVASSRSVLAVPIRYKGRAIGAISVESQRTNPFDDTDVATVTLVADQLTIAVRGAGLFEQTQAQLREISMFRRLADEASVGIITRDFDGIIDYSNPAAATLFGFSDSAVMHGLSMRSLYPDDNAYETDKQLCVEAMREGAWNGEITLQKLDGQPIVVDMSIFPIYAPDGAFMSYATVLRDSTERRRLLNATQQSNARFEAILEATEDGIIVWDKSGRIVMVNAAASRLLNTAPEALIGLTQADLARTHPLVVAAANADEGERIEFLADVRRIGRCRNLPWHSNRASGFLTVIYDITSQVELEQSREELTSMLIHDLLGPLTGIVGGIEMVRDMIVEGESQERVLRFLEMAQRNANLLLDTANSLLDIAQLESGRMNLTYTPLEAGVLLADATGMFENIAHAAGISINVSCEANLPSLLVDAGMIRRALTNLLDNALKFTPGGGQVSIAATREGENLVRFSVSDTGPGIPEAYRWRIFEKYVQVPEQEGRRRGKGLGLVFCRLVAEAHQGRVWVEPRPGGGCVFVLTVAGASPTQ